jgi:hypothetical protein
MEKKEVKKPMELTLGDKICIDNQRTDRYPVINDYYDEDENEVKLERDEYGELVYWTLKPKKPIKHIKKRIVEEPVKVTEIQSIQEMLVEIVEDIPLIENVII